MKALYVIIDGEISVFTRIGNKIYSLLLDEYIDSMGRYDMVEHKVDADTIIDLIHSGVLLYEKDIEAIKQLDKNGVTPCTFTEFSNADCWD